MCGQPHEALKVSGQQTYPSCGPQKISSGSKGCLSCPLDNRFCCLQSLADSEAKFILCAAQGRMHNSHAADAGWHLSFMMSMRPAVLNCCCCSRLETGKYME